MNFNIFIITSIFFTLFILGLSVGYIFAGKKLQGVLWWLVEDFGKDCDFCDKKDECKRDEG